MQSCDDLFKVGFISLVTVTKFILSVCLGQGFGCDSPNVDDAVVVIRFQVFIFFSFPTVRPLDLSPLYRQWVATISPSYPRYRSLSSTIIALSIPDT